MDNSRLENFEDISWYVLATVSGPISKYIEKVEMQIALLESEGHLGAS